MGRPITLTNPTFLKRTRMKKADLSVMTPAQFEIMQNISEELDVDPDEVLFLYKSYFGAIAEDMASAEKKKDSKGYHKKENFRDYKIASLGVFRFSYSQMVWFNGVLNGNNKKILAAKRKKDGV